MSNWIKITRFSAGKETLTETRRSRKRRNLGVEAKKSREVPSIRRVKRIERRGVTRRRRTETGTGRTETLPPR